MAEVRFEDLESRIQALQNDFDSLERMARQEARSSSSDEIIGRLVKSIQSILHLYELDFSNIPENPSVWTGDETRSLIDRLRKAGRYVDACDELLRAARRNDIFSDIEVKFVNLQRNESHLPVRDLDATEQLISACCSKRTMSRIAVQRKQSVSGIRQKVREELGKKARIHAEIQILLHYEEHPIVLRPRVICSSKSACYLCQLFFSIHGQYHIPSTHGRLYDTWKWPECSQLAAARYSHRTSSRLKEILPEFSQLISDTMNQCLDQAPGSKGLHVAESLLDVTAILTPSLSPDESPGTASGATQSVGSSASSVETLNQQALISDASLEEIQKRIASASDRSSSTTVDPIMEPAAVRELQDDQPAEVAGHSSSALSSPMTDQVLTATPSEPLRLQAGESRKYQIGLDTLLQIYLPGLHVYLENGHRVPGNSPCRQPLVLDTEYLPSLPGESVKDGMYLVDLDEGDWVEQSPPDGVLFLPGGLVLKRKSTLLRLRVILSH